jgi:formate dehydrogenase maturation protein FdhE
MTTTARTQVPTQRGLEAASLTQVRRETMATCPVCGGHRLTKIAMTLTDGSPVDFTSCHTCEHKSWIQNGQPLAIDVVLAKAKKHK